MLDLSLIHISLPLFPPLLSFHGAESFLSDERYGQWEEYSRKQGGVRPVNFLMRLRHHRNHGGGDVYKRQMLRYDDCQRFHFWSGFRAFLLWEMEREYTEEKRKALISRGGLYYDCLLYTSRCV